MMRFGPILLVLCALAACDDRPERPQLDLRLSRAPASEGDPVIATFADDRLTASQLEERLETLAPRQRSRQAAPEGRRELVDGIAHFELLAREAARQDLHNAPEISSAIKQLMVRRLLEQLHAEVAAQIAEPELEAWYQAHLSDFQRPARVRVFYLFLSQRESGGDAALKTRAKAILERARALAPRDTEAFSALVREASHDLHSRPLGGDLRFRSHAELAQAHGEALADAAFALPHAGALSGWIQGPSGLHLLRLEARESALALSLSHPETHTLILRAVRAARERDAERELLARLAEQDGYRVDEGALQGLPLEAPAPSGPLRPGRVDAPAPPPVSPDAIAR